MVSERTIKNRVTFLLGILLFVIGGAVTAHAKALEYQSVNQKITDAQTQKETYERLIATSNQLRVQYDRLARKYLSRRSTVASLETSFTSLLAGICSRDGVSFVGVNYGEINGSAPPAPSPQVDANGQPVATPQPQPPAGQSQAQFLGGEHAGDPKTQWPQIPSNLFTRIPASITISGNWKGLMTAVQDIPKGPLLLVVSDPAVRRFEGSQLTLSVNVEILAPAVAFDGVHK